jgi:putative flavoprotein involved in K+ transport
MRKTERIQTVIIGAGQAGLAAAYYLKRRGLPFILLEAHQRVGDAWRKRWDSLHLFTPARFDSIAGLRFPAPPRSFPSKDAMADYLESYVRRFDLPVRTGMRVEKVARRGDRFEVTAGDHVFEAENVIVAMASFQKRVLPEFAGELDPSIVQMHSSEYRNPGQLQPGDVLLVGAGNSGAEIGLDVVRSHRTWLSGRDVGHVPFRVDGRAARVLMPLVLRVLFHRVARANTPWGRKFRKKMLTQGGPLVRTKPSDLAAAGVERVPRVAGVQNGKPMLEDGRVLDVANVIWCTGFNPGFSWIDLPVFDQQGWPEHERGAAAGAPGLYFLGLMFIYAASSTMVHGVSRDAKYIAGSIAARVRAAHPSSHRGREEPSVPERMARRRQSAAAVSRDAVSENAPASVHASDRRVV